MEARAIGIDVGGTKIAGVRVDRAGAVEARATAATPPGDQERTFEAIVRIAEELASPAVRAVGVGAAGLVTWPDGVIRFAPNNAWREFPLRARLAEATGLPCIVDNDAAVAALAEHRYGAGRGARDLLLVTVGTGIGGGIVVEGRPFRGAHGFAAEIGHVIVEPGGPRCGCGNLGCWEQVASGTAIERAGRAAARERPGSRLAGLAGGDP
ncbi:MAG TPA: ROK family protein, partial [Actinomycetota bacterium]|nr:ROK family protein [Actinomycetota bacterium]